MNWCDERYVRVYTRDTTDWVALGWEAQALFLLLLRKLDRVGSMDMGRHGARGLAALVGMPLEVVERCLPMLLEDGCIERHGDVLVCRNFIEAQEASMSPTARQQESRLRRRDQLRAGIDPGKRTTVVYFIQSEHGGEVKIGHADDLAKRLVGLSTGRPDKLVVLGSFPATVADERRIHEALADDRVKGEWFLASERVMSAARAAGRAGAVTDDVLSAVTSCDASRNVTGHSVPCLAVPSVPSVPDQNTCPVAPDAPLLRLVEQEQTRKPDPARQQATSWLEWFNRKFSRSFRVTDDVVRMVKALNARGYQERPDMRGVALFLRDEWQDDPKMAKFLRPDSILVASKFGIRLDEAKERYPEIWAERVDGEEGGNAA